MVKLSYVRLVNCQSHKDTLYEFNTGLNVIVAPNNTGKTVLLKITKIAVNPNYLPNKKRVKLIREGAKAAMGVYGFSDGTVGVVSIQPKEVLFYFSEDGGKSFSPPELQPDPKFVENLGIITDRNSGFFGNILDMDQGILFVSSNNKVTFDMLKMVTSDGPLDEALLKIKNKIAYFEQFVPEVDKKEMELSLKKSKIKYTDVDALEDRIVRSEELLEVYETLVLFSEHLSYVPIVKSYSVDFELLLLSLDLVENLSNVLESTSNIKKVPDTVMFAYSIVEDLDKSLSMLSKLKNDTSEQVELLDQFLSVDLHSISKYKNINFSEINNALDDLEILYSIEESLGQAVVARNNFEASDKRLRVLNAKINTLGEEVPCVIYGKVRHADGICIPVGDRPSQETG